MDRLTYFIAEIDGIRRYSSINFQGQKGGNNQDFINAVGLYEDTGLTTAEVAELVQAKKDGLVLVIPCKVGDTVFSLWSRVDSKKQYIRSATVTVSNLFYYLRRIQDGASFVSRDEAQAALDRMERQK